MLIDPFVRASARSFVRSFVGPLALNGGRVFENLHPQTSELAAATEEDDDEGGRRRSYARSSARRIPLGSGRWAAAAADAFANNSAQVGRRHISHWPMTDRGQASAS